MENVLGDHQTSIHEQKGFQVDIQMIWTAETQTEPGKKRTADNSGASCSDIVCSRWLFHFKMKLQNLFFSMAKFNVASKRMYELYRGILNYLKGDMFNGRLLMATFKMVFRIWRRFTLTSLLNIGPWWFFTGQQ